MAKLSKDRLIFGVLLIVLIALGEIILATSNSRHGRLSWL